MYAQLQTVFQVFACSFEISSHLNSSWESNMMQYLY